MNIKRVTDFSVFPLLDQLSLYSRNEQVYFRFCHQPPSSKSASSVHWVHFFGWGVNGGLPQLVQICSRMCSAVKNEGKPFGGINMIFSGDFAQLPPAGSEHLLFSHKVRSVLHTTSSHLNKRSSIGKTLWHQFTTVIILRENMRQKQPTPDDAKMRKALENLRYKSCIQARHTAYKKMCRGHATDRPKLNQLRFRYVSIIMAWNTYRDKINELSCARFVRETGQQLITFYSQDKWRSDADEKREKTKHVPVNPQRSTNMIDSETQRVLWNLPHDCTDNHLRKLTLCLGLPVMIKTNEATECCVTNGAEGVVAGWKARPLENNKLAPGHTLCSTNLSSYTYQIGKM